MKILDRYVARNFLTGYAIAFCVLVGLRIIIDLFVNLDEFTEHADVGAYQVGLNIAKFYLLHSTVYFRDFAGMITIVAAAFSLSKMVHCNELVAIMSSGVSLKRVIAPIIVLSIILTGLLIVDKELVIPALSDKLVRSQDTLPGEESYDIWFLTDNNGSLICSKKFDVSTATLFSPTIIVREPTGIAGVWEVAGQITADKAVHNNITGNWDLENGLFARKGARKAVERLSFYESDLKPRELPVRHKGQYKALLSLRQLSELARYGTKDLPQLHSERHFRLTEPLINLVMLLICLPVLVCRDPKTMKSAIMTSFALTTLCFIATFFCRMMATEPVLGRVMPEFWAWLPVIIFLPVALIELDSMKT